MLHGTTFPRIVLLVVLDVVIAEKIYERLHIQTDSVKLYTNIKVVLGNLNNHQQRFYKDVVNVAMYKKDLQTGKIMNIQTGINHADLATIDISASHIDEHIK